MTKCECEIPTMEEAIFRECEECLERYDMAVVNGHVVNNKGEVMKDAPLLLAEVKRLRKRNEWLEEVVALAQEHGGIDLSDYGWPQWREEE